MVYNCNTFLTEVDSISLRQYKHLLYFVKMQKKPPTKKSGDLALFNFIWLKTIDNTYNL